MAGGGRGLTQGETGDRMIGWGHKQEAVQRWEAKPFQVSGLGRREPGTGFQVRVQVQDLNFARHPHLCLNTRARDLRAETWDLRMCLMAAGNIPVSGLPLSEVL